MINILIADDHAVVRQGLRKILSEHSDMNVAAEAKNSDEVLDFVRNKNFDVILLDISMPGRTGLEILKDIRLENQRLPVLIFSMFPEEQFARRVLKAGASGYMTKGSPPDELIKAIEKGLATSDRPTLIDVPVSAMKSPFQFMALGKVRGA